MIGQTPGTGMQKIIETPEQVMIRAMGLIELERSRNPGQTYFNMIPEEYKKALQRIAEANFSKFKDQYKTIDAFLNEMSRVWLVKREIFKTQMELNGFVTIGADSTKDTLDSSIIAALTTSGSYVLVGPGSYKNITQGAAMQYEKIPLRTEEGPQSFADDTGASLSSIPTVGESLHVGNTQGREDRGLTTSSLIMAYHKKAGNTSENKSVMMRTSNSIREGFESTNRQTGLILKDD